MVTTGAGPRDRAKDLGSRPIGRLLWFACSQTTLSVGVYGIYALTNAWFVSWGVGPVAFAAVNLIAPVLLALGAVATTVGIGGASLVSRALGRGDVDGAGRAAGSAFAVYWMAALLVTFVGLVFLDPLLTVLGAVGETREYAGEYALILLAGTITATGFSALVRAEGRMGFSTLLWVLPVVTQIILDPLLILGLGMRVRGAALGTVGGQTVSMAMSIWFFFISVGSIVAIRIPLVLAAASLGSCGSGSATESPSSSSLLRVFLFFTEAQTVKGLEAPDSRDLPHLPAAIAKVRTFSDTSRDRRTSRHRACTAEYGPP